MDCVDLAASVDLSDLADSVDPSDLADCVVVGCACDALHGVQRAALVFLAGGSMAMDSVDLADADSVDPSDLAALLGDFTAVIFLGLRVPSK